MGEYMAKIVFACSFSSTGFFVCAHLVYAYADPGGGINQIPGECTVSGDVRLKKKFHHTSFINFGVR